MLLYEFVITEY